MQHSPEFRSISAAKPAINNIPLSVNIEDKKVVNSEIKGQPYKNVMVMCQNFRRRLSDFLSRIAEKLPPLRNQPIKQFSPRQEIPRMQQEELRSIRELEHQFLLSPNLSEEDRTILNLDKVTKMSKAYQGLRNYELYVNDTNYLVRQKRDSIRKYLLLFPAEQLIETAGSDIGKLRQLHEAYMAFAPTSHQAKEIAATIQLHERPPLTP